MSTDIQPLSDATVQGTKELIVEVVLEFYGDLDFLPKSKSELLGHYEKFGYLRDLDNYKAEYSPENGGFLVLMEGEDVIGCGGLRRLNHESGELVRLWLRRDQRKKGFGRMIFQSLMETSETRGPSRVYLDTSNRCIDAIKMFKQNGFVECGKYKESIGDVFLCRDLRGVALLK